jgi:hypothetical protein
VNRVLAGKYPCEAVRYEVSDAFLYAADDLPLFHEYAI